MARPTYQDSSRSGETLTLLFRRMDGRSHFFPQMRNAVKIKTTISPTIDVVKSQLHTTEVLRFITEPDYAKQRWTEVQQLQ